MAAIVATLDAMSEEGMVENARDIGAQVLGPGLKKLAERYPMIGDHDLHVAKLYNMLPAEEPGTAEGRTAATNATVRSVFVIGPDNKLKLSRTPGMGNRFAFVAQTDKDPYTNKDLMLAAVDKLIGDYQAALKLARTAALVP